MAEIEATIVGHLITTKATTHGTTSQVTVVLQPSFQEAATQDIDITIVNPGTTIQVNGIDTMIRNLRLGHLVHTTTKITITADEMFRWQVVSIAHNDLEMLQPSVPTRDTRPQVLPAILKAIATTATPVDPSIETLAAKTEEIIHAVAVERGAETRARTGKGNETAIVIVTGIVLIEV